LPAKLAVLTSLNIAGKYVRLKREFEDHKRRTRQNMDNLIRKIESKL
jgi:cell division protein ZapA (FtsZ GTPase activity inhibitor)